MWDLSKLQSLPEDATRDEIVEKAQLVQHEHEKACSSAYFDPTGTRLASTSYDDSIRGKCPFKVWEQGKPIAR